MTGVHALIPVALEGFKNITDLQKLQFGRGFYYTERLMIGMQNVALALQKQIVSQIYQMIIVNGIQRLNATNLQLKDQIRLRFDF